MNRVISVAGSGTQKGGTPRRIPMTARLVAALQAHRHLIEWMFTGPTGERVGQRYTHNDVTRLVQRACHRAGVRPVTYHVLRRTF